MTNAAVQPVETVTVADATLHRGDCLDVMASMPAGSVSAVVTDPPYGLGFMGKAWDHGVPGEAFWREAWRVAKPGAFLLAFGGTRTWHRLACAIEDAGWEVRDSLLWLYGQGFPKSLDISKAVDSAQGVDTVADERWKQTPHFVTGDRKTASGDSEKLGQATAGLRHLYDPATDESRRWRGYGTALKPAWEPVIVAMKPCAGTFAANALRFGVAGLNIDGGRVAFGAGDGWTCLMRDLKTCNPARSGDANGTPTVGQTDRTAGSHESGRWPANVALDGAAAAVLDAQVDADDAGGPSRFFYTSKASRADRSMGGAVENRHPTVKPTDLMRWLVRLVLPPAGACADPPVILDPFMGSGSTGVACALGGGAFAGIELQQDYFDTAAARIRAAHNTAPLFSGAMGD